ncbi:MAG: FtsW/RodA/SpoVE family cell cycle protein [Clostridia bacterium]|nr:FtsW/RodA/SpoVE family cell cycle protein [Clostridia bacterium]
MKRIIKETDKVLLLICLLLSSFGIVAVASATASGLSDGAVVSRDTKVMILALVLGIIISMFLSFVDYDFLLRMWPLIAAVGVGLMLLLFPLGSAPDARTDSRCWFKITSTLYFQPSEVVKIGFIITFSHHLDKVKNNINEFKTFFMLCVHGAIPIMLVIITGDMGSALVFILVFVCLMFIAGVHWLYFLAGGVLITAAAPVIWYKIFSNIQRSRILALFYPDRFPDEIYQQKQASNAIKKGGFTGMGLFKGTYTQSGSVPEGQNDMIFSGICEELGFIGAVILLLLFAALIIRLVYVGKRSGSFPAFLMCCGVAAMIGGQAIINIGMCTSMLPVIGITLPFVSAGGSSVLCTYLAIGVAMGVYRNSCVNPLTDFRNRRIRTPFSAA